MDTSKTSSLLAATPDSWSYTSIMTSLVCSVSYLAAKLGGALMLRPQLVWPLWPGCALLVAVLLLAPRRRWPIIVAAGLGGFFIYDLQEGLSLRSTAFLILADAVEVLIPAVGVRYIFGGLPQLNSVKNLAKYSLFAVILAPAFAAFAGAGRVAGNYWTTWRIGFFTEALALLTVTPAILGLITARPAWAKQSRAYYTEAATLIAGLILCGYFIFQAAGGGASPALLYSLLPFLLWSALRFGLPGISISIVAVACLSTWGAVHGRGPFTGPDPLNNVLSIQLFLFFAATPFMFLAVLVEEQKKADLAVRESEERFRLVADSAPAMIWMSGEDRLCNYFNRQWLDFTGRPIAAELGNGWAEGVHSEDLTACLETYKNSFDARRPFKMQYRLMRHDGEYRWIFDIGVPRFNRNASFAGYIGSCVDITDRKLAEESLTTIGRRLIQAQEEERSRIARELHDDINQRISLLAIDLGQWEQNGFDSLEEVKSQIHSVRERISQLGRDVQAISHRLHSSKLEYLGLIAAARSFCRELSEQQQVEIHFSHKDLPSTVPKDASLCLFRVLQESLQNALKYSGVRYFEVELTGTAEHIHLTVNDSGVGFDPEVALTGTGLGLISMQERVHLVKGNFSINSRPLRGTTIEARVPVKWGSDSVNAA
jgi:PAS domain S-box-containing protein